MSLKTTLLLLSFMWSIFLIWGSIYEYQDIINEWHITTGEITEMCQQANNIEEIKHQVKQICRVKVEYQCWWNTVSNNWTNIKINKSIIKIGDPVRVLCKPWTNQFLLEEHQWLLDVKSILIWLIFLAWFTILRYRIMSLSKIKSKWLVVNATISWFIKNKSYGNYRIIATGHDWKWRDQKIFYSDSYEYFWERAKQEIKIWDIVKVYEDKKKSNKYYLDIYDSYPNLNNDLTYELWIIWIVIGITFILLSLFLLWILFFIEIPNNDKKLYLVLLTLWSLFMVSWVYLIYRYFNQKQ